MIYPAYYENAMKDLQNLEKNSDLMSEKTKEKAVNDTVDILKQFGYDGGANIFKELMLGKDNNGTK